MPCLQKMYSENPCSSRPLLLAHCYFFVSKCLKLHSSFYLVEYLLFFSSFDSHSHAGLPREYMASPRWTIWGSLPSFPEQTHDRTKSKSSPSPTSRLFLPHHMEWSRNTKKVFAFLLLMLLFSPSFFL